MSNFDVFSTKFAQDIYLQKYSMDGQEKWEDTARRVVNSVCGQILSKEDQENIFKIIQQRKFIPGGRYLYSSGRPVHQVNNCFLFRAEDSREAWADTMQKITSSLMSGGGIGVDYSALRPEGAKVQRTGGTSTGPIALMKMVNESGRYIMQGGQRRSAIWAGLNWKHDDVQKFLYSKDYDDKLKQLKKEDLTFPLPMELTNISVIYDTEFFIAIEDENHPLHLKAKDVFYKNCKQAFSTAEPGFSFNFRKDNESLRNACQPSFAPVNIWSSTGKTAETFGNLKIGDHIETYKGWVKVLKKWKTGTRSVYSYTLDNGSVFIGTGDHMLRVSAKEDTVSFLEADKCFNFEVPVYTQTRVCRITQKTYLGEHDVYKITVDNDRHTYYTGGVEAQNCTEVVSEDDSDKCNLGTVWINRIKDTKDLRHVTKYATMFLLCGSIYSDVPTEKIRIVGNKNNRIGLGLGGIHEWLMLKSHEYSCVPELHKWLKIYEEESDATAYTTAKALGVAIPKGVRAIAPTGTIGILAESSTGVEPLFCKAYKRRYYKDGKWLHQYVVDGSVKRLLDSGIKVEDIKDSYDLSFRQRVKFQADVQNYVDMAISSTCNMSEWGSDMNNETTVEENAKTLLKYAKRLRGFTCYPDGCRTGQPLTRVDLKDALANEGTVFEENEKECLGGVCGL